MYHKDKFSALFDINVLINLKYNEYQKFEMSDIKY